MLGGHLDGLTAKPKSAVFVFMAVLMRVSRICVTIKKKKRLTKILCCLDDTQVQEEEHSGQDAEARVCGVW